MWTHSVTSLIKLKLLGNNVLWARRWEPVNELIHLALLLICTVWDDAQHPVVTDTFCNPASTLCFQQGGGWGGGVPCSERILTIWSQVVLTICAWWFFQRGVFQGVKDTLSMLYSEEDDDEHIDCGWNFYCHLSRSLYHKCVWVPLSYELLQNINSAGTINGGKFTTPTIYSDYRTGVGSIMCFFGLYRMLLLGLVPWCTCDEVPGCASLIWMLCSLLATCNLTYMFNHVVMVRWFAALKRAGFLPGVSSVNAKKERGGDEEAAIYQPLALTDDRLLYLIKMVLVWG